MSEKTFEQELGENIRRARRVKSPSMSLEHLAAISGLSRVTINNIELGKVPNVALDTVPKISRALDVPIGMLVGEKELSADIIRAIDLVKTVEKRLTEDKQEHQD